MGDLWDSCFEALNEKYEKRYQAHAEAQDTPEKVLKNIPAELVASKEEAKKVLDSALKVGGNAHIAWYRQMSRSGTHRDMRVYQPLTLGEKRERVVCNKNLYEVLDSDGGKVLREMKIDTLVELDGRERKIYGM